MRYGIASRGLIAAGFALLAASAKAQDWAHLVRYDKADREQILAQGARKEREITLYSTLTVPDLTALADAFSKKYGVKVQYWRAGSEAVLRRIVSETRAGKWDFDVVETNSPELESMVREKILHPGHSPHYPDLLPQAITSHRQWVGTRLNMFVHAYNTNLVKKEDLPRSYADLLHPRWKGKLGIEAEDQDWFAEIVGTLGEEKGVRLFRNIVAANGISVRKGHTLLAGLVASGEVAFALTVYNHNAEKLKVKGAPIDWFALPPAIARVNGIGLSNKPPHPHAALLFYDYLLGPEGQAILKAGEYVTVNRKLDTPATRLALRLVNPTTLLDHGDKWQKLYDEIFTARAR